MQCNHGVSPHLNFHFNFKMCGLAPMRAPRNSSLGKVTFLRGATLISDVIRVTEHSPSAGMTRKYAAVQYTLSLASLKTCTSFCTGGL